MSRHMTCVLSLSILVAGANAGTVSYEGYVFPEETGWVRDGTFDADRSLVDGNLIIAVDLGVWVPLPGGEQDFYRRDLASFAGDDFFVEWLVESDAPSTEIDGVGGSALSISGGGILYHFTIARDTVRLLRDVTVEPLWIPVEPDVAHTYRLELFGDSLFRFLVDGRLIVADRPEGAFPNSHASMIWGSKMWNTPSVNSWDYVSLGTIVPEPATGVMLLAGGAVLALRYRRRRRMA